MTTYYENDVIRLQESVNAEVIGEKRLVVIPEGAKGVIVLVYGGPEQPEAYEVEFYLQDQDCYALATINAMKI